MLFLSRVTILRSSISKSGGFSSMSNRHTDSDHKKGPSVLGDLPILLFSLFSAIQIFLAKTAFFGFEFLVAHWSDFYF